MRESSACILLIGHHLDTTAAVVRKDVVKKLFAVTLRNSTRHEPLNVVMGYTAPSGAGSNNTAAHISSHSEKRESSGPRNQSKRVSYNFECKDRVSFQPL